jgi:DNA-binding NarL/FixJ family response regulator
MSPISVLLADDHDLFCEGLTALLRLRPELEVVGRASDGAQAIVMARALLPDVILMDVRMPGVGGLEATRRIKTELPVIRILMLTMSEDDADLFAAIKSGAQGYVLKNTTASELCRYIEGVMAGEAAISGVMAAKMLAELARPSEVAAGSSAEEVLSEREQEVLHCVAGGLSNRDIAERLVISESTVKKHLRNILAKLHVQNRVQAALLARGRADRAGS